MADLENLVVKLEADIDSFRAEMRQSSKITADVGNKISRSLDDMSKKSGNSFGFLKQAAATAAGFIGGSAFLGLMKRGADAVVDLFQAGLDKASIQEDAIRQLNQALAQSGSFSAAASKSMQDFASQMQQTTTVGDETTLQMLALSKAMGANDEQAQDLVMAAANLSEATGITLESAVKNLGKTFGGLTGELGEVVPELRNLSTEALRNGEAIDFVNQRFAGSAQGAVATYSGAISQLSNTFGDFQEDLGETITQSGAVRGVIQALNSAFQELSSIVGENRGAIEDLIKGAIIFGIETVDIFAQGVIGLMNAWTNLEAGIRSATTTIANALGLINDQVAEVAQKQIEEDKKVIESRNAVGDKISEIAERMASSVEESTGVQAAAQEKVNESLRRQSELAAINAEASEVLTERELERLNAQIEAGQQMIEERETQETDALALFYERLDAEQAALREAHAKGLLSTEQFNNQSVALVEKASKERIALRQAEEARKIAIAQAAMQAQAGILGNLAETAKAFGKEGFLAFKAFASAEATINAISSSVGAYAATAAIPIVGPVLAPIAAATALAAGLANVAKINSTQPTGFAKGGEVPGVGFNDSVPALLTPQETVIDRSTTKGLKGMINDQSGVAGEIRALRADINRMMGMMPRSFTITDLNGRVFMEVINSELRSGRRLFQGV